MEYAQIKDDVVKNIIVLDDESILEKFLDGFDKIVRVDELEQKPGIGDNHIDDVFSKPEVIEVTTKKPAKVMSGEDTVTISDSVLILDTNGEGGEINLPKGQDGMEYSFGLKGTGAAIYKLKPAEGNALDFAETVEGPLRIKFVEKLWIAIG